MDIYQKREMRKNKKMDENTKCLPSTIINWKRGLNEKHFQHLTNEEKNLDFYLHALNEFY